MGLRGLIGALWVLVSPLVSREGIRDPTFQATWGLPQVSSALPAGSALGLDPHWVLTLMLAQPEIQSSWRGVTQGIAPGESPQEGGPEPGSPTTAPNSNPVLTRAHTASPWARWAGASPGVMKRTVCVGPARASGVGWDLLTWLGLPSGAGAVSSPCPGFGDARRPCPTLTLTGGAGGLSCGVRESPGPGRGQRWPLPQC